VNSFNAASRIKGQHSANCASPNLLGQKGCPKGGRERPDYVQPDYRVVSLRCQEPAHLEVDNVEHHSACTARLPLGVLQVVQALEDGKACLS